jgi:hypothetical protein
LALVLLVFLSGCIGVGNVKEYEIKKANDSTQEISSWSGKKTVTTCLV